MISVKKKPFNNYKIVGDKVIIYLERRNKDPVETVIDLKHLERVKNSGFRLIPAWKKQMGSYYVKGTKPNGKYPNGNTKNKLIYLHRFIVNAPDDKDVDHHDHDTLNNRENNLFATDTNLNTKNRKSKNSNNKSGYRNVSWNGSSWSVQLMVEGKNTCLKRFKKDKLEEAGAYAEKMRKELYGEFAGKS